jgi:integrase
LSSVGFGRKGCDVAAIARGKSGVWNILFRYGGKQYHKSLEVRDEEEAALLKARVELRLRNLKLGVIDLPQGGDIWEFLKSDGKRSSKVQAPEVSTLDALFTRYEQGLPKGALEANSMDTFRLHRKHLLRLLGGRTHLGSITMTALQGYVNGRSREAHRGTPISPRTIKKEVATFRAVWNWGRRHGLVTPEAPSKGLIYEKGDEKQPFQTWEQIERQVGRGGLSRAEVKNLWSVLFLTGGQVAECLEYVRSRDLLPLVYPMFVFVAHTGARRSEMVRSRVEDIDFAAKRVWLREKKRDRSVKETVRYVEMTPQLEKVMAEWLGSRHPGGRYTFCHEDVVKCSKKRGLTTGHHRGPNGRDMANVRPRTERPGREPLTIKEATYHFKHALAGSKWAVLRGFHVFRHSFASNLAAAGARQEAIDKMMGHQTEEMRRRYRHLFPEETVDALRKVFGD